MKRIIILSAFSLFILSSYGQLTTEQKIHYEQKIESYERMQKASGGLIAGGAVATIGGLFLMFKGDTQHTVDLGEIVVTLGGGLIVTGIIFAIVGKRKVKQYKEKLDLGIIYNDEMKGITLTYRF